MLHTTSTNTNTQEGGRMAHPPPPPPLLSHTQHQCGTTCGPPPHCGLPGLTMTNLMCEHQSVPRIRENFGLLMFFGQLWTDDWGSSYKNNTVNGWSRLVPWCLVLKYFSSNILASFGARVMAHVCVVRCRPPLRGWVLGTQHSALQRSCVTCFQHPEVLLITITAYKASEAKILLSGSVWLLTRRPPLPTPQALTCHWPRP